MQRRRGTGRPMGRRERGPDPESDARERRIPGRLLRAHRRRDRPAAERARVLARDAAAGDRAPRTAPRSSDCARAPVARRPAPCHRASRPRTASIATSRVILTGGPLLAPRRERGRRPRLRGRGAATRSRSRTATRRSTAPPVPMIFDLRAGIYWRQEEGGLLWGMSNPDEVPGPARAIDRPLPTEDASGDSNRLVPGTDGSGNEEGLGGHHRVHARPPPDPGTARSRARAWSSRARRSRAPAATA